MIFLLVYKDEGVNTLAGRRSETPPVQRTVRLGQEMFVFCPLDRWYF